MAIGGIYQAGTITIASGGVLVTGTGTAWDLNKIEIGDWLFIGGQVGLIAEVTNDTHLSLETAWVGTLPINSAYIIIKMSWLRYDPALTQAKLRELLAQIEDHGTFVFTDVDPPDPSLGIDGQWALQTNVTPWKMWYHTGGVWVPQASPGGGIAWKGSYNSGYDYAASDAVSFTDGSSYVAKVDPPTAGIPPTNTTYWDKLAQAGLTGPAGPPGPIGMNWRGIYSPSTTYAQYDAIQYAGGSYISKVNGNVGHQPDLDTTHTYWDVLAAPATATFPEPTPNSLVYGRQNTSGTGTWTRAVSIAGDTMTGALTLPGNPASALQAAPKQYVDFTAPGTGGLTRSPTTKWSDFVNAADYSTLAQAVAYAAAATKSVYLPSGSYPLGTTTLSVPAGMSLVGESYQNTFITINSAAATAIDLGSYTTLRNLQVRSSVARTAGWLVTLSGSNVRLDNCSIVDGYGGILVKNNAGGMTFTNVAISSTVANSVAVQMGDNSGGQLLDCSMYGCFFQAKYVNVYGFSAGDTVMVDCQLLNASYNMALQPPAGTGCGSWYITNSFLDQAGASNLQVVPAAGSNGVSQCIFTGCWFSQGVNYDIYLDATSAPIDGLQFIGCEIFGSSTGLDMSGAVNIQVNGGAIAANTYAGILMNNGSGLSVTGVHIGAYGNQWGANATGIILAGTASNVQIAGCFINGNTTNFSNSSTGSNIIVKGNIGVADAPLLVTGGSFRTTSLPATAWGLDLTGSGPVSLANDGTYDFALGSGLIMIAEDTGTASGLVWCVFGQSTVVMSNPSGSINTIYNFAGTINVYYNAGTNSYRIQNKLGATKSIFINGIKVRVNP